MKDVMEYTGERMVPEAADPNTYWEHVFRYAFACKTVTALSVLDIASGEGYGTYALSKVSKHVIGVDISPEAVGHAKQRYALDYRVGTAHRIPVVSASVDAVVSFETIEHVSEPATFIREVSRVLTPAGLFIISTPNKDVYHKGQAPNPFHCSELTKSAFVDLLVPAFEIKCMFGQVFTSCALDDFQRIVGTLSNRLGHYLRRRIESTLRRRFLPIGVKSDAAQRQRVIESIPALSPPFNRLWNPYAIRGLGNSTNNAPRYFVAVARKRSARR